MNINMDSSTFKRLLSISKANRVEKSGYLLGTSENQDFYISSIEIERDENIKSSTNRRISYEMKNYLTDFIFRLSSLGENDTLISFHTHPSLLSSINLSEADIDILRTNQRIADKIANRMHPNGKITIIEGVVNLREMAFFSINQVTGQVERHPLFVDGAEIIPVEGKPLFEIIKEGFTIGRKKVEEKRKNR